MAAGPGVDYAFFPHPGTTALKDAGARFAGRYISAETANDANGKNLLPAECKALLGAGVQVIVVVEEGASYMLGGHAAGAAAATHADAVVKALGMPGIPIYIAADFDATPAQQAPINDCLDGMASVIGRDRTGLYGGYWPVSRALDAGKCHYAWQTVAWSGGQWDHRAHIRQGLSFTLGGASVDHDQAIFTDFGQWPRPAAPPSPGPGPHTHLTKAGDTVTRLAASRGYTDPAEWLALQARLGADTRKLGSGPLAAGIEWRSINP
jgi:hypothetical protein